MPDPTPTCDLLTSLWAVQPKQRASAATARSPSVLLVFDDAAPAWPSTRKHPVRRSPAKASFYAFLPRIIDPLWDAPAAGCVKGDPKVRHGDWWAGFDTVRVAGTEQKDDDCVGRRIWTRTVRELIAHHYTRVAQRQTDAVAGSVARALTAATEESTSSYTEEALQFLLQGLRNESAARRKPDPGPVPFWPPTVTRFDLVPSSMPVTGAAIDKWLHSVGDTVAATPELAFADRESWSDPERWATVEGFATSASDWTWQQVQEIASYLRLADASPFHASRHRDGATAPTPVPEEEPGEDRRVALTPISANAPNGGPSGPHETEVHLAA